MGAGKALGRMEQDLGSDGAGRAYDQRELGGPLIKGSWRGLGGSWKGLGGSWEGLGGS